MSESVNLKAMVLEKQKLDSKWGVGIPEYGKDDVMMPNDLYKLGVSFVYEQLVKDGYGFVQKSDDKEVHPSLVMKKDDRLFFILVEACVARKFPKLSDYHKFVMLEHAKKFKAKAMYAPVSFGSSDGERFNEGLMLKGDSYFAHYEGLKEIKEPKEINIESDYYICHLLNKIGEGYKSHNVNKFIKYIDEEARWYSPYSKTMYTTKEDIKNYYYNKFILIDEDNINYFLCYDKDNGKMPLLFIGQESDKVKTSILIGIEVNELGKMEYIKIINPKTVKYGF